MPDYATLKLVWWLLVGVLLAGFAIMDGHDMGVGALLPFAGRNDLERRVVINTVGPHWDGNQVWFITAGGAIFAAWPQVYATAFSGFYWAMLAVLWALFFRPVGFDYRSKIADPRWRGAWDWGLFLGGGLPPVIFGVAFGNLLQGVPFRLDADFVPVWQGGFFELLNPFALLCGVVSSAMMNLHGAVYLAHRTEGAIQGRARQAAQWAALVLVAAFAVAGFWVTTRLPGFRISSVVDLAGVLDPTAKSVVRTPGGWSANYARWPLTALLPALGFAGAAGSVLLLRLGRSGLAFVASALAQTGVIGTAGTAMFPFILPSSLEPAHSLTVWDSASSQLTLTIMLWATLLFMPLIIFYTGWAYRVMSGKVTLQYIQDNDHGAY